MAAAAHASWVRYLGVWIALLVLTLLSYLLSTLHLGGLDVLFAMLIATTKGVLVGLFFMHLLEERFSVVMVPVVSVVLVVVLLGLTAYDVATRHTFPKRPAPHVEGAGTEER